MTLASACAHAHIVLWQMFGVLAPTNRCLYAWSQATDDRDSAQVREPTFRLLLTQCMKCKQVQDGHTFLLPSHGHLLKLNQQRDSLLGVAERLQHTRWSPS